MPGSRSETGPRRIVVGYDGSEAARAAVEEAARRAGDAGEVIVVHTFEAPPASLGRPNTAAHLAREQAHAREVLAGLTPPAGARVEFELLAGPPAEAIARVAQVRHAAEIVVGSRGMGRARSLLGSVSHELLAIADRPVTVIPERAVASSDAA